MKHFYPELALLACILLGVAAVAQQPPAANQSFESTTQQPPQPAVPNSNAKPQTDPDPLLDPPPLPNGKVTLVGGTVKSVDMVRNRIVVQPFGGGTMKMNFDERTRIYRDGVETTQLGIRKGDRVYIDTMLDGSSVFARNIRVRSQGQAAAHVEGQVTSFDPQSGMLVLRDRLSAQPVTFRASQNTAITVDGKTGSLSDLKPGAIISVRFSPYRANSGTATEIAISAVPGTVFTFSGKVTNVDLRSGIISVDNRTDDKTYDINFNIARVNQREALSIGSDVTIQAVFQGNGYLAQSITVDQPRRD